jgi:hypothetical protein
MPWIEITKVGAEGSLHYISYLGLGFVLRAIFVGIYGQ